MPCKWLVYRIYLCSDYLAHSAPWLIGQKRLLRVVAQIMGHKPSAIAEKHYRRRHLD